MKVLGVAFAVFVALSHVEAPALANHRQSIRVAYPSLGLPQAPLWIASAANYFNEVGLRVESLFIQNSSTVIQSMLSDEIDYAMVGPAPVVAVDLRGADIVMIATTIPTLIFYVIARPEIQKVEDLKGKSLGFGRFGSNTDFAARLLLEKYGLVANKDVAMIQTVGGNATVLAVSTGKVHAGITTDVGMLEGKKLGLRELFAFKDLGIPFAHAGFAAKRVRSMELVVIPLPSEPGVRFDYAIAMGVRYGEPEWKETVQKLIVDNQPAITAILREYNVPLVNERGAPID